MRRHSAGLLDLLGAQIDAVVVEALPVDVQFDVAVRLVGTVQDFRVPHAVQVVLSNPEMVEVGRLNIPVPRRVPAPTHFSGYELNHHVAARIVLTAEAIGGYDLSFALDQQPAHPHKATISVVMDK